jgi:hypothetical protein
MKPDYLWDGSGEPDPEVERLERLLGTLRSRRPAPEFPVHEEPSARSFQARWLAVAASVLVVAGAGWVMRAGHAASGWQVARVAGAPRIGSERIGETGRLQIGEWLETDATARARVAVGEIGELDVEPNTRMQLVKSRASEHRMAILHGEIHALIWAPPRRFYVDTPSAVAIDLGCSYTLKVNDRGEGLLAVDNGWVAFEKDGRESFIPTGAACRTRPVVGPGTPYFESASVALQEALERFDFAGGGRAALEIVLAQARKEDAFTLWHLLSRAGPPDRAAVYERLAAFSPPPKGVTREGILARDRQMLDLWWNALGLENANWWRIWERPYRD